MKTIDEHLKALSEDKASVRTKDVTVTFPMSEYGVVELAKQKHLLQLLRISTMLGCWGANEREEISNTLGGAINLIDAIQDDLSEHQKFDEGNIYPFMEDDLTCEPPELDLPNYRVALKTLLAAAHKDLPKYLSLSPELDEVLKAYFSKGDI